MPPITADEEFSKNIKLKRENIEYLRDWLSKQPHLPAAITDEQLILFLHSCQHSLEATKQTIEAYYSIRTHAPDLFGNRDIINNPTTKEALSIIEICILPKRDQNGSVIMVGRITDTDVSKFNYDACLNAWFMLQDAQLLEDGAVPGFVFIFDMKGVTLSHVAKIGVTTVKKYFMYIQDAFPGVVKANHMINANAATEVFFNICKPFMRKELLSKLHIHGTMDTVYEHVPKEFLPKEYGGELGSLTTYHMDGLALLDNYKDWFKKEETIRIDESKRPGRAKNAGDVFGVEGSFKKLDID